MKQKLAFFVNNYVQKYNNVLNIQEKFLSYLCKYYHKH